MLLRLIPALLLLSLISCRDKTSSDAITKPKLRKQIETMQAINSGDVSAQLAEQPDTVKERLAQQMLASMSEATLQKLTLHPKFKEMMKKTAATSREKLAEILLKLQDKEVEIREVTGVEVKRKVGLNLSRRLRLIDPYLKYKVSSGRRRIACEKLDTVTPYWQELLALQKDERLLLGITPAFFEQLTKSCLLYYRLRDSMERCQDPLAQAMAQLCHVDESRIVDEEEEESN